MITGIYSAHNRMLKRLDYLRLVTLLAAAVRARDAEYAEHGDE